MRTKEEIVKAIIEYFEANGDIFNDCINELDDWNGYLGDDRMYPMEEFDDFFHNDNPMRLMYIAFYGNFNPNHNYFYFNGYGNLMSSDYLDYSDRLDKYFVDDLLENRGRVYSIDDNDELSALFDELEAEEDGEE